MFLSRALLIWIHSNYIFLHHNKYIRYVTVQSLHLKYLASEKQPIGFIFLSKWLQKDIFSFEGFSANDLQFLGFIIYIRWVQEELVLFDGAGAVFVFKVSSISNYFWTIQISVFIFPHQYKSSFSLIKHRDARTSILKPLFMPLHWLDAGPYKTSWLTVFGYIFDIGWRVGCIFRMIIVTGCMHYKLHARQKSW